MMPWLTQYCKPMVGLVAVISVVHYDALPELYEIPLNRDSGSQWLSLNVGEIAVTLTMESFSAVENFCVIQNLTVD